MSCYEHNCEGCKTFKCLELEAYKMAREQAKKMVWTPPELREIELLMHNNNTGCTDEIKNKCARKNTSYCYLCSRDDSAYDLDDRFEDNFKELTTEEGNHNG